MSSYLLIEFILAIQGYYKRFQEAASSANKGVNWDRIVSIKYAGVEQVWDISVKNTHNFVANGLLAHNTAFIVDSAGNVGIASTSPWGLLSVNPNGITGPAFVVGSSTATNFIVTNGGNVGIGTTSPAGLLHLNAGSGGDDSQIFIGGGRDPGWAVPAVQFGERNTIYSRTAVSGLNIAYNAYTDGSNNRYITSLASSRIVVDGSIGFDIASSGTAGAVITYTRAMTIADTTGNVGIIMPGTQNTVGTCHSTDGTGGVASSNFLVDCSSAPGDIAEWYDTISDVEVGDIVTPSSQTTEFKSLSGIGTITDEHGNRVDGVPLPGATTTISVLEKSQKAYDQHILGVVSTAPYQTFGEDVKKTASHPERIALNGRVPVKVNLEGGAIQIGDRITSSSMAGVGMKATTSGMAVGIALEPYDGTQNLGTSTPKILVFINLGYSKLDVSSSTLQDSGFIVDQATGRIKTSYVLDMDNKDIVNARNILSVNGNWSINESGKIVAQEIDTQKLQAASGVTTKDKTTGEFYCIFIDNGVLTSAQGACGTQTTTTSSSTTTLIITPDTIPPTITILGNNPATINIGASYADPGVTITDNVDSNLGYTASVDGGPALSQGAGLTLDTSTTTTHTILYAATDQAGNTATSTRIVQVVAAP